MSIFFALIIKQHEKRQRAREWQRQQIERAGEYLLVTLILFRDTLDVMSTTDYNPIATLTKVHFNGPPSNSSSTAPQTPPPVPLPLLPSASLPSSPAPFNDDKPMERFYKKEKQISLEFDQIVKGMRAFLSSAHC